MSPSSSFKRAAPWVLVGLALFFSSHGTYFLVRHLAAMEYLREEILPRVDANSEETILASALFAAFDIPPHRGADNAPDYGIRHPAMKALGPSADLIHMKGGHCGRRARLLIAILKEYDIPARKVHLINNRFADFNHSHHYVHAVVEAQIDSKWVVVDPLYNLIYRTPEGFLASLHQIQGDREGLFLSAIADADTRFSPYFTELYTFDDYRKFIWNSFPGGERFYKVMEKVIGSERARELTGPEVLEVPHVAIIKGSYTVVLLVLFGALVAARSVRSEASSR